MPKQGEDAKTEAPAVEAVPDGDWIVTELAAKLVYGTPANSMEKHANMHAVRDLARRGKLASRKIAGRYLYLRSACEEYRENRAVKQDVGVSAEEARERAKLDPEAWLTPAEAADKTGKSKGWIYKAIQDHRIWGQQFYGVWLVNASTLPKE